MSLNFTVLMGRLTKDPEFQPLQNTGVCRFVLAVNEPYKDRKTGEFREITSFIDVEVWGEAAERFVKRFSKGDLIAVQGRLRTDVWEDKDGNRRKRTYVRADIIRLACPKKKETEAIEETNEDTEILE